jgi:hypothetical protein
MKTTLILLFTVLSLTTYSQLRMPVPFNEINFKLDRQEQNKLITVIAVNAVALGVNAYVMRNGTEQQYKAAQIGAISVGILSTSWYFAPKKNYRNKK